MYLVWDSISSCPPLGVVRAACCQSLDLDHHPLENHGRQGSSKDLLHLHYIYCSQERWEPWVLQPCSYRLVGSDIPETLMEMY